MTAPLAADPIDPPTLAMTFSVNDSPLAGREGDKVTSRVIGERLLREAEGNVAIRVRESAQTDAFEVAGRGELQLGVLIETMRREGFELSISRPRVLFATTRRPASGSSRSRRSSSMSTRTIAGIVIEKMSRRKGEMQRHAPVGRRQDCASSFLAPTRGLIGYHGEFLTDTRGTGVMSRLFHGYAPLQGSVEGRRATAC